MGRQLGEALMYETNEVINFFSSVWFLIQLHRLNYKVAIEF